MIISFASKLKIRKQFHFIETESQREMEIFLNAPLIKI
jgi:hypothetical protein